MLASLGQSFGAVVCGAHFVSFSVRQLKQLFLVGDAVLESSLRMSSQVQMVLGPDSKERPECREMQALRRIDLDIYPEFYP
jgi:hypothetical protein